jgi:hypothetical protein
VSEEIVGVAPEAEHRVEGGHDARSNLVLGDGSDGRGGRDPGIVDVVPSFNDVVVVGVRSDVFFKVLPLIDNTTFCRVGQDPQLSTVSVPPRDARRQLLEWGALPRWFINELREPQLRHKVRWLVGCHRAPPCS